MTTFSCFMVRKVGKGQIETSIEQRPMLDLPAGEVLVRVAYSSLNYKDALAATDHPGVVREFPHVPGIDAAGTVVESTVDEVTVGQAVVVTSYNLGTERWGGWAEYIRVPAEWVIPLPEGLSARHVMALGTAGFTAALCVDSLQQHGIAPSEKEVVVTGATGGVGILTIKLLADLGHSVVAVSGKSDRHDWLMQHGAACVIGRDEVNDDSGRPLLSNRWAGAVDTVGGNTLATLLRSTRPGGCVAACGLVGGADVPLTVYPFILRGVTLAGIDSAFCPRERRIGIWRKLTTDWKLSGLDEIATTVELPDLAARVQDMLAGKAIGRTVVRIGGADA